MKRLHGACITLVIVGLVVVMVAPVGLLVSTVSGYVGGWLDTALVRVTDVFLAFPRLILALAFVSALGPGIENAVIAIACTAWPPYARIARAETLTIRRSDFIAATRLQGAGPLRIILRSPSPPGAAPRSWSAPPGTHSRGRRALQEALDGWPRVD